MTTEYIDDYPSCDYTDAAFRITGDDLDPEEISRQLGIEPSHSHRKGEPHIGRSGYDYEKPWSTGVWLVSSEDVVKSLDLRRHLDWVIGLVRDKADVLAAYRQRGFATDVLCYWVGGWILGIGPTISPDQMRALAALGLELIVDGGYWGKGPKDMAKRLTEALAHKLGADHPALSGGVGDKFAELYALAFRTTDTIDSLLYWDPDDGLDKTQDYDLTMQQFDELYADWTGRPATLIEEIRKMRADGVYPHDDEAAARLEKWRQDWHSRCNTGSSEK